MPRLPRTKHIQNDLASSIQIYSSNLAQHSLERYSLNRPQAKQVLIDALQSVIAAISASEPKTLFKLVGKSKRYSLFQKFVPSTNQDEETDA